MSKIGDSLRNIANRINSKPVKQTKDSSTGEQTGINTTDQVIKGSEEVPVGKMSNIMSQVKEAVIDPIKDLIKEHPDLSTFITAMAAGGVAGLIEKNAEEKKEIKEYLENLNKFTKQVGRSEVYRNLTGMVALALIPGFALVGGGLSALFGKDVNVPLGITSLGIEAGLLATSGFAALKFKSGQASKDGRFIKTGAHEFVTVPPSGDKLIFCEVLKGLNGKKPFPTKEIVLPQKGTYLTFTNDKKAFYVNYEDGKRTKFSLYGEKLQDINLANEFESLKP